MKRIIIPEPPNPETEQYRRNPLLYQRALFQWSDKLKTKIEQASSQNDIPLDQNFVLGSFTTNTTLSGTSTGTDVSNFLCTVIQALINRGMISTNTSTA